MLVAFSLPVKFSTLDWNWLSFYLNFTERDTQRPAAKELNTLTTSKSVIGFIYNDFHFAGFLNSARSRALTSSKKDNP